jgi:cell division protein FtsI/penicillin-binding protein 2
MILPYILSLIFLVGLFIITIVLIYATASRRLKPLPTTTDKAPLTDLGPAATNRWLGVIRFVFFAICLVGFGFHAYWSLFAAGPISTDNKYSSLMNSRDRRNLRLDEGGLRGWVYDRTNQPDSALIRYRFTGTSIDRVHPLGPAAAHLTGYSTSEFGRGGLERAFNEILTEPVSTYNKMVSTVPVGKDVQSSIISDLQQDTFSQFQGKKAGAAVVIDIATGEVLAMTSWPSFDPAVHMDLTTREHQLKERDDFPEISPLTNRATEFYYRPGSTFKTFIAAVAVAEGKTDQFFTCKHEGFTPPSSGREINDFDGEVHGRIGFDDAFRVSCNQYFAQLGLLLGKETLAKHAQALGLAIDLDKAEIRDKNLWSVDPLVQNDFVRTFAPPQSRMNLTRKATPYDVALQSFGQGYDDLTVIQMALLATAVARPDGNVPMLRLTTGGEAKIRGSFIPSLAAERVRQLMRAVVTNGTAAGAFNGCPVAVAGKTGTADRDVRVFDPKTRTPVKRKEANGKEFTVFAGEVDGWFIGFAPFENPKIAFAVVVEAGGQGAKSAAPIARSIVMKASQLGLFGAPQSPSQNAPRQTPRQPSPKPPATRNRQ